MSYYTKVLREENQLLTEKVACKVEAQMRLVFGTLDNIPRGIFKQAANYKTIKFELF